MEPNPETQRLLDRAQHELDVEERSNQQESRHFSLRYEGGETSLALQRELLGTLEEQYGQLARELDYSPRENMVVTLYTQKQFFDITEAPSWASGLNDGKLRIPIQGVTSMTPELQHVLKHELTHSFVRFMVGDRCPSWLNEGLAQLMEPRSSSPYAGVLAGLFEQHKQIPFAALEHPFNGLSESQANVAYAESLSALDYLRSRYGMDDVLRILRRVGSGEAPESALRAVTRSDYADLEKGLAAYLQDEKSPLKQPGDERSVGDGCPILALFARVGFHRLVWRGIFVSPSCSGHQKNPHPFRKSAKGWGTLGFRDSVCDLAAEIAL